MGKIADLWEGNRVVDWGKASKELDLAILRVQSGALRADKAYTTLAAGCKVNNIPFGSYAYGRYVNVADAEIEAKTFLSRIDKHTKFLCVDIEEVTTRNLTDLVPATQKFIDVCRAAGHKIGLYTGHSFYYENNMNKVHADFLWIPRYSGNDTGRPTGAKPTMACDLWQYTEKGVVSGITGDVDLNMLIGDKSLAWFTGVEPARAPYKVIIPNTAFWQAKALVLEFEQRGFSCEGVALKTYRENQVPEENDPYLFIIYTDLQNAKQLVIELKTRGYTLTYGEEE